MQETFSNVTDDRGVRQDVGNWSGKPVVPEKLKPKDCGKDVIVRDGAKDAFRVGTLVGYSSTMGVVWARFDTTETNTLCQDISNVWFGTKIRT